MELHTRRETLYAAVGKVARLNIKIAVKDGGLSKNNLLF